MTMVDLPVDGMIRLDKTRLIAMNLPVTEDRESLSGVRRKGEGGGHHQLQSDAVGGWCVCDWRTSGGW